MKNLITLISKSSILSKFENPKFCRFYSPSSNFCDTNSQKREPKLQDLLDDSASGTGSLDEIDESDEWRTSPYPTGSIINPKQSQGLKSLRPKIDPSLTSVVLFPGQGSQYVGMGKSLLKFPAARDIFDATNEILKFDLLKLMLHGPKEKLNQTKYCQLAVVVCSLAALEKLKEERPSALENCICTAGFSVGEITALTFAGVFKFGDAIKLVRTRAEAMQIASEAAPGGMATVIYSAESRLSDAMRKAKEWCIERGIDNPECRIATYLHPNMKVIAGHTEALRYLECNKKYYKLSDIKRLPVKGAFHTNLMLPAFLAFRKKLNSLEPLDPLLTVHSNVDGQYYKNKEHVIQQLPKQMFKPIKWEQMLHILYERDPDTAFPETLVCGPNSPLKEYLRGVNAKAAENCINALKFLSERQSEFKLRKVIPVPVSGAFHTSLMLPAVDTFSKILAQVELNEPSTYIYSNVTGKPYKNLKHVQKVLPTQIYKPVMWEQLIHEIYARPKEDRFPSSFVCGPKAKELKTMIRYVNARAACICFPIWD